MDARTTDIIKRRTEGETYASIARRYGLSRERIRQILQESAPHLATRKPSTTRGKYDSLVPRIVRMRRTMSYRQIEKVLKVPVQTLHKLVRDSQPSMVGTRHRPLIPAAKLEKRHTLDVKIATVRLHESLTIEELSDRFQLPIFRIQTALRREIPDTIRPRKGLGSRDAGIVEMMASGRYTAQQVAEIKGMSRANVYRIVAAAKHAS